MRSHFLVCSATALAVLACLSLAPTAHAQLLNTQVTGSFQFGGVGLNLFNPAYFLVPNGYSNKTQGTTVTVADPAIEFGYRDFFNTDSVNITANTITLTDITSRVGSVPFLIKLTDTAFAGQTFNKVSDTFANGGITYSLTGNTLSLSSAGFLGTGTHTAVFNVTSAVPEPGSVALLVSVGTLSAGFLARRKKVRKFA